MYGAFVAVVLVASKQKRPRDGHLTDSGLPTGCPLTALDLSIKTKVHANIIQKMLDACSSEQIGWIECSKSETPDSKWVCKQPIHGPASAREVPGECLGREGKEGNGIEGKEPPISPDGGNGDAKSHIWFPSDEHKRFNKLFNRRETTHWGPRELKALKAIQPVAQEDFELIQRYYTATHPKDKDYRRKDLLTLLNNWNGEVDRARAFISESGDFKHEQGF
jgi:hypothetical protein